MTTSLLAFADRLTGRIPQRAFAIAPPTVATLTPVRSPR